MNEVYLTAMVNAALCGLIAFTCGCRQAAANKDVLRRVRWGYSFLGTAAILKAGGPWLGQWPGWLDCVLAVGMLSALFAGSHRWRFGALRDVQSDYQPLPPVGAKRNYLRGQWAKLRLKVAVALEKARMR